ncbi:VWA domain-containing protein [Propioniciclava sinopodophylli]|uniref:VWA domain-containing protein n=1 Tax=Propioniciclava sinopodophylli TaxID=1837344 RepID=A0A4Q9KHB5_9ACTN|nr:VWA domain-containing protein [Propioniciclava sinopodophylli]TBT88725.1 VWA domain-containing protein [Propioniciclava sinopodophylli]
MPERRPSRYGRYHGGPDPLAPPVDLAEALDAIAEDVMAGYSPENALREFLRRGGRGREGLDDLARRVQQRRRDLLRRHNLGGTLDEVRKLLDAAVLDERKQLARDAAMDDDDRAFREMRLQNLPTSTAAAVNELASYDWQSREAAASFDRIKDLLGRELLDQRFAGMKRALESADDADREAVNQMLSDLNGLLDKHRRGEDTDVDFDDFMAKHGHHFPENPRNVEELIDALAQRSAAAQRLLNSMTAEQRRELMDLSAQAFGSPGLMAQLGQLDANLQALRPGLDWGGAESFRGSEGLGLGDGTGVVQDLAELDALGQQIGQDYGGARMDDLDLEALARQLGPEAAVSARTLAELERAMRDSGYLRRGTDGSLRLSPRAMRRLGKTLLADAASRLSGRQGQRDTRQAGAAGEQTGATRPWRFGDTEPWDTTRTLTNAIHRTVGEGLDPGTLRIDVADIEVAETETRTQSAVALLVDVSFSMAAEGRWVPMKRTALALHHLVSTRFRGDQLQLITFGRHAGVMDVEELTALGPWREQGTNLHHGLLLAGQFFRKHPTMQPVLLVVTDGEPTAHLLPDGYAWFSYPPDPETISATVVELDKLGRRGAQATFVRLGDDPGLQRFIEQMARRVGGRAVAPDLDDLGGTVVDEYLRARSRGRDDDLLW